MGKVNHDKAIRMALHPSVSELEYNYKKLDIFWQMARTFADHLPQKWQSDGVSILEKSGCFRDWILQIIEWNNVYILQISEYASFPKHSLESWYQWQLFYNEENGVKPPKIVLQVAVNEWLHRQEVKRVSQSAPLVDEPVKP